MRVRLTLTLLLAAACGQKTSTIPDPSLEGPKTWYGVIEPLVATRCGICHASGDIAPFPLNTLAQVKAMGASVRAVVETKYMPPFPPDQSDESGCPRVDDVRRMSDAERKVLLDWVDDGMPEGEARELPELPKNEPLGPPSDSWEMTEEYVAAGDASDDYRCFVVEPHVLTQVPVAAVSVKPGNRAVVHHAAVYLIPPDQMPKVKALDAAEAGPGYTCFGGAGIEQAYPTGLWVPGNDAPLVPPHGGVGYYLLPGWGFVVQQHYNYASGREADKSSVVLWRADAIITEVPHALVLADFGFNIPPNTMGYSVDVTANIVAKGQTAAVLNEANEGRMYSVWAHQHQLGKSFEMDLVHADGSKQCLLHIGRWDFNWQSIYKLKDFVPAKAGDKVTVKCTWDNPRTTAVTYGENTSDEMCIGSVALLGPSK
ncbi:MAG: hypothetical protein IPJ65_20335 [Archangiaceae bacterium]|nr:hypothetical protein [Archangiaceae bacterium]